MKKGDSLVQSKPESGKPWRFTKQFVLFITIFIMNSLSGLLVYGQNQTSKTLMGWTQTALDLAPCLVWAMSYPNLAT